ncbi:MAG: hypothetical protein HY822_24110, partial [Acidobacteria bacterium]|nr:hypothetical protein [Acidobacteriota bacterium]
FRYNPALAQQGKNPLQLDSKAPTLGLDKYIYNETRYSMLKHSQPEAAKRLFELAEEDVRRRWRQYEYLAAQQPESAPEPAGAAHEEKE